MRSSLLSCFPKERSLLWALSEELLVVCCCLQGFRAFWGAAWVEQHSKSLLSLWISCSWTKLIQVNQRRQRNFVNREEPMEIKRVREKDTKWFGFNVFLVFFGKGVVLGFCVSFWLSFIAVARCVYGVSASHSFIKTYIDSQTSCIWPITTVVSWKTRISSWKRSDFLWKVSLWRNARDFLLGTGQLGCMGDLAWLASSNWLGTGHG